MLFLRRHIAAAVLVLAVLVVDVAVFAKAFEKPPPTPGAAIGSLIPAMSTNAPLVRDLQPYAGLGAWVDGFDFGSSYQRSGADPPVDAGVIDDLAAHGVKTLFLQAARDDTRSPGGLVEPDVLGSLLIRAHQAGIKVVAWYLPRFRGVDTDLAHLQRLAELDVLGHRFDGIAVDIEYTDDVPDVEERNTRLIELSKQFRAARPDESIGAIVLPPVQTEVINTRLWPDFPWLDLKALYDVWLPMSYWTFRTGDYGDGYAYNEESTRRLRANLSDARLVVHGIGGIGDIATADQLQAFAQSLVATGSVGGSIYDWNSMTPATRATLANLFRDGAAAKLPAPP